MGTLDLCDPGWFPANYLASSDAFRMIRLDLDTIGRSSFLDRRMQAADSQEPELVVHLDGFDSVSTPCFLFHTAFCGSTLLSRALHAAPGAVSLKEPSVLLDISSAFLSAADQDAGRRLEARLGTALSLLARPWQDRGRVLIKPTNQVNRLLLQIRRTCPRAKGVLLYSSLEEFVISCFKKLPVAETRVRWMAQHLLVGSELSVRLAIPPLHMFNLPESCVFAWYAQMERYAKALELDSSDALRTLDMGVMLDEPLETVRAAADWLDLPAMPDVRLRVENIFKRDSKAPDREYSNQKRALEKDAVTDRFGDLIARTLRWASDEIHPYAVMPYNWKPLMQQQPRLAS